MKRAMVVVLMMVFVLFSVAPLYAQLGRELYNDGPSNSTRLDNSIKDYLKKDRFEDETKPGNSFSIIKLFKSKVFAAPKNQDEERKRIREEWKDALGLDVFYPYFKAKEIEDHVKEKTSVKLFNMKGRAEFKDDNSFQYIFKRKF